MSAELQALLSSPTDQETAQMAQLTTALHGLPVSLRQFGREILVRGTNDDTPAPGGCMVFLLGCGGAVLGLLELVQWLA